MKPYFSTNIIIVKQSDWGKFTPFDMQDFRVTNNHQSAAVNPKKCRVPESECSRSAPDANEVSMMCSMVKKSFLMNLGERKDHLTCHVCIQELGPSHITLHYYVIIVFPDFAYCLIWQKNSTKGIACVVLSYVVPIMKSMKIPLKIRWMFGVVSQSTNNMQRLLSISCVGTQKSNKMRTFSTFQGKLNAEIPTSGKHRRVKFKTIKVAENHINRGKKT